MVSNMNKSKKIKNIALLLSPLLLFAVLFIPYSFVNQEFIVGWFGCGCPKVDKLGNIIHPDFNANDFTALFWAFTAVCVTAASVFFSKRIPKEKTWLRITYVAGIFVVSLFIAYNFIQMMMWN